MRHSNDTTPRASSLDRVASAWSAWETGTKLYGLVRGAYTVGRAVAPYVAALL